MYNVKMADDFHAIEAPENFGVTIIDNEDFLTVLVDPKDLLDLSEDRKVAVVDYINSVKKSLENNGAIVLISRKAIDDE